MGLGGPAASIALLVATLILTWIFPDSTGVRILLVIGLIIVISSSLPYTLRGHSTDAEVILLLIRKGPAAERLVAALYILTLDTQQIQPRDWPRELVEKLSIPTPEKAGLISAVFIRYASAMDSGNAGHIAEAIESALSVANDRPDIQRASFVAASCFHSIFRNNVPLAEAWLESARNVRNTLPQPDWDAKALAAIALANGEHDRARDLLTRYLAVLDRKPASGMIAAERARTVELLGRA
jgi:hypothetical protein